MLRLLQTMELQFLTLGNHLVLFHTPYNHLVLPPNLSLHPHLRKDLFLHNKRCIDENHQKYYKYV